jgi:hypothetical protein
VKNTCSGNTTQWEIAANNFYGPIINRVGTLTAAVSSPNGASSTLGSHGLQRELHVLRKAQGRKSRRHGVTP